MRQGHAAGPVVRPCLVRQPHVAVSAAHPMQPARLAADRAANPAMVLALTVVQRLVAVGVGTAAAAVTV
eukprot:6519451-Prymnesium_polylepis.1